MLNLHYNEIRDCQIPFVEWCQIFFFNDGLKLNLESLNIIATMGLNKIANPYMSWVAQGAVIEVKFQ